MGGIDPILCAQDIPREMRIIGSELEGKKTIVMMETSLKGHLF